MKYLVDTDWIIDHFRGDELITRKLEDIAPQFRWVEETKPNIFLSRATEDNLCKYFKRWGKGYSETNMRINHSSLNFSIVRSA